MIISSIFHRYDNDSKSYPSLGTENHHIKVWVIVKYSDKLTQLLQYELTLEKNTKLYDYKIFL